MKPRVRTNRCPCRYVGMEKTPMRSPLPPKSHLLLAALIFLAAPAWSGSIVVDGACTLADAILAANSDADVGSCTGASGADTIVLDVNVVVAGVDVANSQFVGGARAGLPDVRSELTIEAGQASVIERDLAVPCDTPAGDFRLISVRESTGHLTLRGLTLRYGCAFSGGALATDRFSAAVIEDVAFVGNRATAESQGIGGGAIFIREASSVNVTDSTFLANRAVPTGDFGAAARGGAIYVQGQGTLALTDSVFEGNEALGAIALAGTGGAGLGGAIYATWNANVGPIVGCRFEGNRAVAGPGSSDGGFAAGGAITTLETFEIRRSVFIGNEAVGGDGEFDGGRARGGAVRGPVGDPGPVLSDVLVIGNQALGGDGWTGGEASGGGVWAHSPFLERVTVVGNLARGGDGDDAEGGPARGGGVCISRPTSTANLTVVDNEALGGDDLGTGVGGAGLGGGVFIELTDTRLSLATVAENRALGGSGAGGSGPGLGGGIRVEETGAELDNVVASGNEAGPGGAPPSANDCSTSDPVTSLGHNWIETPGTCSFSSLTDEVGVAPGLLPLGSYGCSAPLPGGRCLPVRPLAITSPALDRGSCLVSGATSDGRDFSRPWDFPAIVNLDDGCDPGAYEARDEDGDGVEDGLQVFGDGFESGDTTAWALTVP